MQVAGLNHFIFVRQILHKGKEWLPEVIAEINAGRDPLVPRNISPFRWPSHLLQGLGMIPCAYLRYYYMKDDLLRQELAEAGITVTIETVDSATLFAGMADGKYDMAIASHTPGALPLWFTESRFTADNNLFHVAELTPYTQAIAAVKGAAEHDERQARVEELQALLAGERPFIPLWFGRTLHVQSPTVDGIDYPSSAFSNENVWDWVYRG